MRRTAIITSLAIVIALAAWLLWPERAAEIPPGPPNRALPVAAEPASTPVASAPVLPVVEEEAITPAPITGGTIIGRVYTMDGSPVTEGLARVTRMSTRFKAPVQEAGTETPLGPSAEFTVTGLKAGHYAIEVASGDLVGREGILLLTDETVARVTVRLRTVTGIAGVVVGDGGAPVAGARVRLVSHEGDDLNSNQRILWDVETGADGSFAFDGLQAGTWQGYVTAAGYAPLVSEPFHTGDTGVRLQLTHGGRVAGRAVEGDSPRPAAGVALKANFGGVSDVEPATATAAANGRFEFAGLAPGTHTIATANPEHVLLDGAVRVDVDAARPLDGVVLRIGTSATVRGVVFDAATGGGMAGAVVWATARDASAPERSLRSPPADEDGAYEILGLAAGSYGLNVGFLPPGYTGPSYEEEVEMRVEAIPGETLEGKDIPVYAQGVVSGIVVGADGTPAPGAAVEARATDRFQWDDTVSGEGGRFTLVFAPGREIHLRATGFDRRSRLEGPLLVPAEGLSGLRLVLDEATDAGMAGIVVDRAGNPLRAHVTAQPTDMDFETEDSRRVETTGVDGLFLFMGLPPGEYDLDLAPVTGDFIQQLTTAATIRLAAGEMRSGLRLVYDDSGLLKISGRVFDGEGRPIKDASIYASASSCPGGGAFTDRDGAYTIFNVCDGESHVRAQHPHYGTQILESVAAGSENVDFVLVRRGRLIGQVIDAATGAPVTSYQITGQSRTSIPRFQSIADTSGQFSIEVDSINVFPLVRAPGYADQEYRVEPPMAPGEDRDGIVIALQRAGQ